MKSGRLSLFRNIGPGIVVAATGVGAGDLIAATVSGARFGTAILWAAVVGAIVKFVITEQLTRWQLVTGTTLLEGWIRRLPRIVVFCFLVYLLLWSFIVGGALITAAGLAAHALLPALPVAGWGVMHSLAALALVWRGGYRWIETAMKLFIGIMFVVVMICGALLAPPVGDVVRGMLAVNVPAGSVAFVLGVIGGVGGSVTVLSYGYWIRERRWRGVESLSQCRVDLAAGYGLTGLFGVAVMVIAAGVDPEVVSGSRMVLAVAEHLGSAVGTFGKWCFLVGFWAAVFSSMLGVWQGIPYLFADVVANISAGRSKSEPAEVDTGSAPYRGYLLYLALPPMVLLAVGKPVWVVVVYAVAGAFFMPFLAALLLYMNNRRAWVGTAVNRWRANMLLTLSLLLFVYLLIYELRS